MGEKEFFVVCYFIYKTPADTEMRGRIMERKKNHRNSESKSQLL